LGQVLGDRKVSDNVVTVVLAGDQNYAMPLAVAASSVISTLDPRYRLQLCVLDMGIEPASRKLMEETFDKPGVETRWVDTLKDRVGHLPHTFGFITRATYARLYIPSVLPDTEKRALYLDCDTLARRSVSELFFADMDGAAAMGSPDVQSPFVSSTYAVPYWADRGRQADDLNYNAGVLLMDLDVWRKERINERALEYLTDGRHHFAQDQEAINAVLPGQIKQMDPRWNQQSEIFQKQYEVIQPFSRDVLKQIMEDPWLIHYCNVVKPWHYGFAHPFLSEWYAALDQTAFAGWRPSRSRHIAKVTYQASRVAAGKAARGLGLRKARA
jgi:lipopolysaccharide biosynthesis glycosyltransferase